MGNEASQSAIRAAGSVLTVDAATGAVLWRTYFVPDGYAVATSSEAPVRRAALEITDPRA